MQNSIVLNLRTQGFSIPKESMTPEHIIKAISMLTEELFESIPDHMHQIAYERLIDDLDSTCRERYLYSEDDLPF